METGRRAPAPAEGALALQESPDETVIPVAEEQDSRAGASTGPAGWGPLGDALLTAPQLGERLLDRYEVVGHLGRGATGVVCEVVDRQSGVHLAMKSLRVPRSSRASLIKAEFRAVRDLQHPNLVRVHELFVTDDLAFMTMELIRGEPLDRHWKRKVDGGDASAAELRRLLLQCAEGVDAIHRHGLIHRDLKPGNIMCSEAGRVTIVDFGLAHEPGAVAGREGTHAFMSPEQLAGQSLTPASDWYAFGRITEDLLAVSETALPDLEELSTRLRRPAPTCRPDRREILRHLARSTPLGGSAPPNGGPAPVSVESSRFIGRSRELAELRGALAEAVRGGAAIALVHGPAGIGKSRLVRHFLDGPEVQDTSWVLASSCSQYESVPFNAFDPIIEAIAADSHGTTMETPGLDDRSLARLFPVFRRRPDGDLRGLQQPSKLMREQRDAAFDALRRVLQLAASRRPLLLAVDDVQWAAPDSVDLLRHLVRSPIPGVALIASWREQAESSDFVRALELASDGWSRTEVALAGLTTVEARGLVDELAEESSSDRATVIVEQSAGNPLFIAELVATSHAAHRPATLQEAMTWRIQTLGERERRLLDLVCVCARALPRDFAHHLSAPYGGSPSIKHLVDGRFLQWTGGDATLDVYHATTREAAVRAMSGGPRARAHADIARALEGWSDATAFDLAHHLHGAGDPRALEALRRAADEAMDQLAFHRAVDVLRVAQTLPEVRASDALARDLSAAVAATLAAAGRPADAADEFLRVAAHSGAPASVAPRIEATKQMLSCGRSKEGLELLHALFAECHLRRPATSAEAAVGLLAGRVKIRLAARSARRATAPVRERLARDADVFGTAAAAHILHDTLRGAYYANRQLDLALRCDDPKRILQALVFEALYLANEGVANRSALEAELRRAEDFAAEAGDAPSEGRVALARGIGSLLLGDWSTAETSLARAEQILSSVRVPLWWELGLARKFRSITAWFRGNSCALEGPLGEWIADAGRRGDVLAQHSLTAELMVIHLARDRPEEAEQNLALQQAALEPKRFDEARVVWLHNRMHHALYTEAPPPVLAAIAAELRPFRYSMLSRGQLIRVTTEYYLAQCRLVMALGEGDAAPHLRAVRRTAARLSREGLGAATLFAEMLRAADASITGDAGRAATHLERAAAGLDRDGQPLMAAAARARLGQMRGGEDGRRTCARALGDIGARGVTRPERMLAVVSPGFEGVPWGV